jgi:rod shape-determining protein MreC
MRASAAHVHGLILISLAAFLIILNLLFPHLVSRVRVVMMDMFAPLLHAAAKPAEAISDARDAWQSVGSAREENEKLQKEVAELRAARDLARQYAEENRMLKDLLKYKDESVLSFLTARVIAQADSNFADSLIITAGSRDGVSKNMIAMNEEGIVGRVIEVGEWSSRVLLLNDLSFRLPVMVEDTRARGILVGDGDLPPKLMYLPSDSAIKAGAAIVTSGHGGLFPPYLPVGRVAAVNEKDVTVTPHAHLGRLHMLRLVQYNLAGGTGNPMNAPAPENPAAALPLLPASGPATPAAPPVLKPVPRGER